jgi:hypothetical protein
MAYYDDFVNWLPPSFLGEDAKTLKAFLKALGRQFDDLETATDDVRNQFFVPTATWGLDQYEAEYAIKLVDGGTYPERRNNVMAKMRGGIGATPAAIMNVLAAYGYQTQIFEDFPNYQFTIKFTDFKGIPSNMGDLKLLLSSMIPAHLKVLYQYLYNVYADFNGKFTYGQMNSIGLTYQDLQTKTP